MSSLPSRPSRSTSSCRPDIRCSQNFLREPRLVAALLEKSSISRDDIVYEIGPGKGIITGQLARRCKRVIAVEKDPRLAALLAQQFADTPNVTIHPGDFLRYPLPCAPYKVFANIPFNITAAIVSSLTTAERPPDDAYLAMQQEAAEMFIGLPRESLRTVLLKPWFEMEIVHRFRRTDFLPAPRVDVVMLRLRKRGPPLIHNRDKRCFRDFAVYVFTHRQPSLGCTLKRLFSRPQLDHVRRELGIDLDATPTFLTIEQWQTLFAYFTAVANERALRLIAGSAQRLIQQQGRLEKHHRTRRAWQCHW